MHKSAVLFIIFNRPGTTQKVFNAIRNAKPERLYIAADAPRSNEVSDHTKCHAAKSITENVDWPCEVKRLYQDSNLGCSIGPRKALEWFFSNEPEGIILEDDCLPHPDFFSFASDMLNRYRNNKKIISVNGSNLGYNLLDGNSYTFSRYMNMWGWATWADRARDIDYSLAGWKKIKHPLYFLHKRLRQNIFDFDINWYKYWKDKFDLSLNYEKVTWWDWQWIWHQVLNRQLSIVPARNLVSNIGFTDDATHTKQDDNPAANITTHSLTFPLKHPKKISIDRVYEERFVKWVWCYYKRLPHTFYIKSFLKKR